MCKDNICDKEKIDILGRERFVQLLFDLLETYQQNNQGGRFAVYGDWGIGKSFIFEMLESKLEQENYKGKYLVIPYNAWEYDYYGEPLIALLVSMQDDLAKNGWKDNDKDKEFFKKKWPVVLYKLVKIATFFQIGNVEAVKVIKELLEIPENLAKEWTKENNYLSFDGNSLLKSALKEFQDLLKEIADKRLIVLIIDELDRCLPQYQIKVLERMHHLLNGINGICIYAISEKQLRYTVKSIFGENVDFNGYMKKFIDYNIVLKNAVVNDKVLERHSDAWENFQPMVSPSDDEAIKKLIQAMLSGVNIRVQEKIWEKQQLLHAIAFRQKKEQPRLVLGCEIMILAMLERKGRYRPVKNDIENWKNGEIDIRAFINDFLRSNAPEPLLQLEDNLLECLMGYTQKANDNIVSHGFVASFPRQMPIVSCADSIELQILCLWTYVTDCVRVKWTDVPDMIKILREHMKDFYSKAEMMQDED